MAKHSLRVADRVGLPHKKERNQMLLEYREMATGRPSMPLDDSLWREDRGAMSTAANMLRTFLWRAMAVGARPGSGDHISTGHRFWLFYHFVMMALSRIRVLCQLLALLGSRERSFVPRSKNFNR
ncbi:hypothetical protein PoB_002533700 [Plakobranchus ocellatus]|uniref:Uncharacterized protein n=1 Tax=Plakobranchus ocellatus TaxID=259542 RepID=A0AAV3ZVZ6_9GAST|nr:hypothetical protein PoB_002533700 [Plakobranchus ocellatus]